MEARSWVPMAWIVGGCGVVALAVVAGVVFSQEPLTFEVRRLYFAAGVLAAFAFLLVLGAALCVWGPATVGTGETTPGRVVFDSFIKVIPPIITLVLGFYFGQVSSEGPRKNDPASTAARTASTPATQPARTDKPATAPRDAAQPPGGKAAP